MEAVEISVQRRTETGKGPCRRLRAGGRVPGTFYGPKREAISVSVDAKEFDVKIARLEGTHLMRFQSDDPDLGQKVAMISERQDHPVSGFVLHADFLEIDMTQKLEARVPLHFIGIPVGVTQEGGILQPIRREIEVTCLPIHLPEFIEVDVSALGIHDNIHVSDLKLPDGVEPSEETNHTLVTVQPPTVEEVKVEEAAPAEGEAAVAGAEGAEAAGAAEDGDAPKKGDASKKEES